MCLSNMREQTIQHGSGCCDSSDGSTQPALEAVARLLNLQLHGCCRMSGYENRPCGVATAAQMAPGKVTACV